MLFVALDFSAALVERVLSIQDWLSTLSIGREIEEICEIELNDFCIARCSRNQDERAAFLRRQSGP